MQICWPVTRQPTFPVMGRWSGSNLPTGFSNFSAANTSNIKAMINDVKNGVASRDLLCGGNSTCAGWSPVSGSLRSNSWPTKLAAALAAQYGIQVNTDNFYGGAGFTLANYEAYNSRIGHVGSTTAISGSTLSLGGGTFLTTNTTDILLWTTSRAYNRIDLYFVDVNTDITVTPTLPAEVQTVTTAGATNGGRKVTLVFPTPSSSFQFKASAAVGFRIIGAQAYNAGEIELRVHNCGWGGSVMSQWSPTDTTYRSKYIVNLINPKAVIFGNEINDANTAVAPATHQSQMSAFLTNITAAGRDIIVMSDHWAATQDLNAVGTVQSSTRIGINAATIAAATALNLPSVDRMSVYPSYAYEAAQGWTDDASHFNASGYLAEAGGPILSALNYAMAA